MAYRLKRSESVAGGVKRVITEELDSSAEGLEHANARERDEAVHEARKSVKKIRGALRLVEPELRSVFRDENRRFRDLGHRLSEVRDAQAMLEVFDSLAGEASKSAGVHAFGGIRSGLEKNKRETEQAGRIEKVIRTTIGALHGARKRVAGLPLSEDGFAAVAPGLKLTYARGAKALTRAQKKATAVRYHDLRKRVKDHWYHMRLLESLWTDAQQARQKSLHELETWLGDDHNLVLLCERLRTEPAKYGGNEQVHLFLALAAERQANLRANAIAMAQRLYEEKPGDFMRRMKNLWRTWQHDPDSIKAVQKQQRKSGGPHPAGG